MPTGQVIANNVLTAIGVNRPGYTPNAADSADVLVELNALLDGGTADDGLVYSVGVAQYLLVAAQASYQIGVGAADFSVTRPSRIAGASIVAAVGGGTSRTPLRIVKRDEFFGHGDLSAAASSPDELYADYGSPYCTLYLFPAPSCPTVTHLELETWTQLTQFPDLVTAIALPPGYQDWIQNELGMRLLSHFNVTDETILAKTQALAKRGEGRLRTLNAQDRMLDPAELPPAPAPPAAQQQARQ